MANASYLKSLVGGLPAEMKAALGRCWDELCNGGMRFGPVDSNRPRAENMAGIYVSGTTSTTANAEFSIAHGLGTKPSVLVPVLDLNTLGSQLVPMAVSTRAADVSRVYLTSSSTNAAFTVYLE